MRLSASLPAITALTLLLGCTQDATGPGSGVQPGNLHPELNPYAVALRVNLVTGVVSQAAPASQGPGSGPNAARAFALLGRNEVRTTVSNFARGSAVNGRVSVTFDVALTSLLNSGNLVTPTFPLPPVGVDGLLLIPFAIEDKQGHGSVLPGTQWDGAPFNFFNDFSCGSVRAHRDCYRYETFPSPLGPGATSGAQTVGFDVDAQVHSFTVLMILAADIQNTPQPPPASGAIAGHVTSPTAGALQGVTVTIPGQTPVTTDVAGAYQFTGVPLGQVTVALSDLPAGCADPGPRTATVLAGGLATADFAVTCPAPPSTTGSVAGTVTSPTLGNLYGVIVVVNPANKGAATDGAGVYSIPGVPEGQVTVSISNLPTGCINPGTQGATVIAGGSVPVNFSVGCGGGPTTGSLTGTLNAPGGPLPNVTVTLEPGSLSTTSDTAGVYSFANLAPGIALLSFSNLPTGCANPGTQAVEIVAGRGAVLNLQLTCGGGPGGGVGAIRGVVASSLTGGMAGIGLRAVSTGGTVTGVTGAGGAYLLQGLAAGQVEVALDPGALPFGCTPPPLATATVTTGAFTTLDITVTCLPVSIAGVVTDLGGAAVAGATVTATQSGQPATSTTAADGSYGFINLAAGTWHLTVEKPGCASLDGGDLAVSATGTTTFSPHLDCPPVVRGTVTAAQGSLPAGLTVEMRPDAGGSNLVATIAGDGSYSLTPLPGGYFIFVNRLPSNCSAPGQSLSLMQQANLTKNFVVDCPPATGLVLTPSSYDFGEVGVDIASAPVIITVTNAGSVTTGPLNVPAFTGNTADFTDGTTTTCASGFGTASIPPGQSCQLVFRFTPTTLGNRSAVFTVEASPGGSASVTLTGTGTSGGGTMIFTPAVFEYGEVLVGSPKNMVFTLANTADVATGPIQVLSTTGTNIADFTSVPFTGSCFPPFASSFSLPAGQSCTLVLAYKPSVVGPSNMTVTLHARPGGDVTLTLRGTGVSTVLTLDPPSRDFGSLPLFQTSAPVRFTITNTGPVPSSQFVIQPNGADPGDFAAVNTDCPSTALGPGASCFLDITFSPQALGPRSMSWIIGSLATGPVTLTVSGTGTPAVITP